MVKIKVKDEADVKSRSNLAWEGLDLLDQKMTFSYGYVKVLTDRQTDQLTDKVSYRSFLARA